MAAQTPEGKVKDQIKKILAEAGASSVMTVPTGYGRKGVSDFLVCHRGKFIAIEAKADRTKRPTRMQEKYLEEVKEAGGVALVIHDTNLELLRCVLGLPSSITCDEPAWTGL